MGHPEFCSCLDLWFHGWVVEIWAGCAVGIKVVKLVFVPGLAGRSVSFPTSPKAGDMGHPIFVVEQAKTNFGFLRCGRLRRPSVGMTL